VQHRRLDPPAIGGPHRRGTLQAVSEGFTSALSFEAEIRKAINRAGGFNDQKVDLSPKAQVFPDISLAPYGIEVKFTENDTWRSVANSVFEGTRSKEVTEIYVVFGKMGGEPEVRWSRYEDAVMHVRTSHVPRFELEIGAKEPLFAKFGVSYADFCLLDIHQKMEHVRAYARGRLKKGERLWWLEDGLGGDEHTLPLEVRLYMNLTQKEKRNLRAEGTLLCPQVCSGSRVKNKYNDVVIYFLTYHGIFCPQARDLFSAGSVALRADDTRGGIYIARAIADIEEEMHLAAQTLDDALFVEYWGTGCPPEERIDQWLRRADHFAPDWQPSAVLFQ